ncbi:MAG: glutamine-hydrolyzing carbamoyl-phosphate synthase small subunit [Armatimonadetes bacterium]|nr:glutamine-hydrolyzing carbamoyl-phosphate synthase small subunit [Armatimonadota bacterium]MDE2205558.1 glutamine-hydrolyzing carbamoyl-phosphate synthase small subunit [Armatimonadota bacterium]
MRANLVLSDGAVFQGESLGRPGTAVGEVVFNTGMTGYQEILTDPSYAGQIVSLTYPLIGNYGVTEADFESRRVQVSGFVVREAADEPSNWRSEGSLHAFLNDHGVVGIQGIDTRQLTRRLRAHGVMMGMVSTEHQAETAVDMVRSAPGYSEEELVYRVSTPNPYTWRAGADRPDAATCPPDSGTQRRIALLDCGVKFNILRSLAALGCHVTVFPAGTSAAEILRSSPDGVVLSPGPGDPASLGSLVNEVRKLAEARPVMGVCMGNQLLGSAFGSKTFKLKFGHRGSNHPVRDLVTGRVAITSQNHGYALDADGLTDGMEVGQINLNDGTVEGLRHRELPVFSIQYHPEASPGPHDSAHYFKTFVESLH